jgi:subtilisin family serine protease
LPEAWKYSEGEGVKIAVLDSGCALHHPDISNNLLPGINLIDSNSPPEDDTQSGHGTFVTGIICAKNNDIGMVGVAPQSKVFPVKVLDKNGNGALETVAEGIKWAIKSKADVICMSLGAPFPIQNVRKAIQAAEKQGIITFVAAGNSGFTDEVFYPAAYPETIAIGSIDENFNRSTFSCTGKNLDFLAPGGEIFSTVPPNWYALMSGTSMAAPFVAGLAALILSYKRKNGLDMDLSNAEAYRQIFKKHVLPLEDKEFKGKKFYQGFGIIDPQKFIEYLNK